MAAEGNEVAIWNRLAGKYDRTIGHFSRSYPRVAELARTDLAGRDHPLEVAAGIWPLAPPAHHPATAREFSLLRSWRYGRPA